MTNIAFPFPGAPNNGEDFDADPVRENLEYILSLLAAIPGDNLVAKSVLEAALEDAINPRLRASESFSNFVYSGGLPGGYTTFGLTVPAGIAYTSGYRHVITGQSFTVGASKDTYFSVNKTGVIETPQPVNNGASRPTLAADCQWLFYAVSDGAGITSIVDLRNLTAGKQSLYTDANGWSVTNFGSQKIYRRSYAYTGTVAGGGNRVSVATGQPLPVGIANAGAIQLFSSWRGNYAGHATVGIEAASADTTFSANIGNIWPSALGYSGVIEVWGIA